MIKLISWPPSPLTFTLSKQSFTWEGNQPFIETDPQGEIVGGWLNQILAYGKANNLPEESYSVQTVYKSLVKQLSHPENFFDLPPSPQTIDLTAPSGKPPSAPLPPSVEKIARQLFPRRKWGADAAKTVAELGPSDWLSVLERWKQVTPENQQHSDTAGPVWWYAIHSLALNHGEQPEPSPESWINFWHGAFPCDKCRRHFYKCPVPKAKKWEDLFAYADEAHNWVTANK